MSFRTCFEIYSNNIKLIEVDKLKTTIIFKYKKIVLTFFLIIFFFTNLFAKESQLAGDAKKALKEYAGYKELINRGFNLNMLNNIKTPEDLYKVLEPFMIIDGKPLDNTLSFNGYNFARHKTIHFENVYGTIQELLNKGYKPDQLFYYPSKGKEIYRVGNFVWEKPKPASYPQGDINYYNRPFMGKKIAYFFPGAFTKDYFKPYIKEISKKEAIIVDLRLNQNGWGGQLYQLGESLCQANYKGKVILIIDQTTGADCETSIKNNLKNSYYINGSQKKCYYEWITLGENTSGKEAYVYNAKWNYKVGDLQFNPLPVNENQWIACPEGEGVMPDIWAANDEDINKTIEQLTGEKNFAELIKDVSEWRAFLCSSDKALWNWQFSKLPDIVTKIKSHDEYNKTVAKILKLQINYCQLVNSNQNVLYNFGGWNFQVPECASKAKNPSEYIAAHSKVLETKERWIKYLVQNHENLINLPLGFEFPDCFSKCSTYAAYADNFNKWIQKRTEWTELLLHNKDKTYNTPYWWDYPDFFKSFKTAEQYTDYFSRWIDLRIWWCSILFDNTYVIQNNNIRIWYVALKEDVKEWKDPEKHLAEMSAHLKELSDWIVYLQPHPYVIPKDRGMANFYGAMRRTSDKIGKNCSAMPEDIVKLQKTNPKEYVEKVVAYINSVAENDFEKIKMVFDIEQEILTYDYAAYQKDLELIDKAKKGVGEDYELYSKNLNEEFKKDGYIWPGQDWKTVLEKGICVCEGYSRLMQYFCYRLGIKCDVISNPKDMMFAVGHAWNIVQINGEDYFLDATWGPAWLFMEPEAFLKGGHFPKEPEQQLLEKPMTLDEYKKLKNYEGNNS